MQIGNELRKKEKASFPILPGYRLGQIFRCTTDSINKINLYFGCYARSNTCPIKFTFTEITNLEKFQYDILFTKEIPAEDLIDNRKFEIKFPSLYHVKGRIFYFYIESVTATVDNCVCLWLNNYKDDSYSVITNNTFDEGSIVFQYFGDQRQKIKVDKNLPNITVDIIICVHNQAEYVRNCIRSVQTKTIFSNYKIIVVDDGSDNETKEYLKKEQNIELHTLSENLGYIKAANYGLRVSEADYKILLNSDTEVTEGWLTKAIICGESDPNLGILGLVSNNATWQSIPNFFSKTQGWAYQDIPEPFNIDEFALLVEALSEKRYPRSVHIHGSCFIIKRAVIEKIGYLDDQNYICGYHEEDDYCHRAHEAGFDLAWVDNAFYFHHGKKSFTPQRRKELIQINSVYYNSKWGEKDRTILENLKNNNPLDYLRKKIKKFLDFKQNKLKKIKIGYLLNPGHRGGGSISIFQIINKLQDQDYNVNLVCHKKSEKNLKNYSEFKIKPKIYETVGELIGERFDVLIATHNVTVEESLMECHKLDKNLLTGYFIQDFEPFFYPEESDNYKKAFRSYTAIPNIIAVAKTHWICQVVKNQTGLEVIKMPPGLNTDLFQQKKERKYNGDKIYITAMIRPQTPRRNARGTLLALKEIKNLYPDLVEVKLFGISDNFFEEYDLNTPEFQFKYQNLGHLDGFSLADLFNSCDIFVDGSLYQAFGRTALEAMACGCAAIVPTNGGTNEYARHKENCLVVDTGKVENIIDSLEILITDEELRKKLSQQGILDAKQYTIEREAKKHLEVFAKYHFRKNKSIKVNSKYNLISHLQKTKYLNLEEKSAQEEIFKVGDDLKINYFNQEDTERYNLIKTKEEYTESTINNKVGIYCPTMLDLDTFEEIKATDKNFEISYIHFDDRDLHDIIYPLINEFPKLRCNLFPMVPLRPNTLKAQKQIKVKNITFFKKISRKSLLTIIPDFTRPKDYDIYLTALLNQNILFASKQNLPFLEHELTGYLLDRDKIYWGHYLKYILKNPSVRADMVINSYQQAANFVKNSSYSNKIASFIDLSYDLKEFFNE